MGELLLYKELDGLDEIDVFGVSPYGDLDLLERISPINRKKIFIYKIKDNQEELLKWKSIIGDSDYLDSTEFAR